jgi:hypothetical protein
MGSTDRLHRQNTVSSYSSDWHSIWLILAALLAGVLIPLTRALAGLQDGDGLLTSIISTDGLTWYFWGQDRLANTLPAIASVISDSDLNLRAQLFMRACFAWTAPFGILVFFSRSPRFLLLGTALANVILVWCLSNYPLFNIYVQHNPFGTSMVAFGLAHLLVRRSGFWPLLPSLLLCLVAYATNFALMLLSAPLVFFMLLLRPAERRVLLTFSVLNVLAIGAAYFHAQAFGEHATSFIIAPTLEGILAAFASVAGSMLPIAAAVVLAISAICHSLLAGQGQRSRTVPYGRFALSMLVLTAALITAVLGTTGWLKMNGYNIRYFTPVLTLLATAGAMAMTAGALHYFPRGLQRRYAAPLFMAISLGALLVGLDQFGPGYSELIAPPWRAPAKAVAKVAIRDDARLIIGDFWDVWPVVYEVHRERGSAGIRENPIFGGAYRGHPMSPAIVKAMQGPQPHVALCLMPTARACIDHARTFTQIPADVQIDILRQQPIQIAGQQWIEMELRFAHVVP